MKKATGKQFFAKWLFNKVLNIEKLDKPLFSSGPHKKSDMMCVSFVNGLVSVERLQKCTHEEADDQIFFHASHAIKVENYGSVIMASPDTDTFVSLLHHSAN